MADPPTFADLQAAQGVSGRIDPADLAMDLTEEERAAVADPTPVDDPSERHAAALAAIDRAIQRSRIGYSVADVPPETVLEVVRVVAAGLEGRRCILERHAPVDNQEIVEMRGYVACDYCDNHWPCPDWRDAAGLPLDQERTEE